MIDGSTLISSLLNDINMAESGKSGKPRTYTLSRDRNASMISSKTLRSYSNVKSSSLTDTLKSCQQYDEDDDDEDELDTSTVIEGKYNYDYNIINIHNHIIDMFRRRKDKDLADLVDELADMKDQLDRPLTMGERKKIVKDMDVIKQTITDIEDDRSEKEYRRKSEACLREYQKMGPISTVISFTKKDTVEGIVSSEDPVNQIKRYKLIGDYLMIARKYIRIEIYRDRGVIDKCVGCGESVDNAVTDEYGINVCTVCGIEEVGMVRSPFHRDKVRVSNSRNNYEDRENFLKVLNRYQGRQTDKPPAKVYEDLELYFCRTGVISSEIVRQLPVDKYGQKEGTSRALMYKALCETGNSKYYDDINLICHNLWGWKLRDISHICDRIMADYDLTQGVYDAMPKQRKSTLNSQFRLLQHLLRYQHLLNYPIRKQDFKIPTTSNIIEWHIGTWKKIITTLKEWGYTDWEYIPIM